MKKILASLLAITMVISTMSACIIPAAAENPVLTEGFKEDFENYGTGNWLANMTADSDLVDSTKISNMGASDWTVYGGYYATEQYTPEKLIEKGVSVGVVADPDNADNQVLKIDVGNFEANEWIRVRRNSNDGSAIKRADLPKGKKMVIKAKFKLPTEFTGSANTVLFTYDQQSKQIKKWMNENMSGNYNGKKWTVLATDAISYGSNLQSGAETTVKTGEWFDLKYIVDITDHKTEDHPADTYRAFYDGSIYTHYLPDVSKVTGKIRDLNKKFPQPSETAGVLGGKIVESFGGYINPPEGTTYRDFGSFYGASMTVAGSGKAGDYMYMDDIEVYYIDPFKQEEGVTFEKTNNGIWYAGKITIPFNNDLMTVVKENGAQLDYASLFTLKNEAGEVVEGGIANAYAEGKNLIIEPAKAIERNASYTISASPLFMDAEGQGLNQFSKEQDILTFETAEDPYAHIYFNENFDDYTDLTSNWTENLDTNGFVNLEGIEAKTWKIGTNAGASNITKGIVKVAKDPLDSGRGNVLEINSGTHDAKKTVNILRTPNGENPITHASMTGKRIVIEADIYMPTAINVQEETLLAYYGQSAMNKSRPNDAITPYTSQTSKGRAYLIGSGNHGDSDSLRVQINGQDAWHTYRYVIDVSGEVAATRIDTHRGYVDGNLIVGATWERGSNDVGGMEEYPQYEADGSDRKVVDFWKRNAGAFGSSLTSAAKTAGDFYGVYMSIRQNDSQNQAYYVDNIKAYYVEDLELTRPNLSNYTGGTITLAFNQEIPETFNVNVDAKAITKYNLSDMITLADKDGNEIEDGLNVKLSNDKKSVIVSPKKIESNNDYKIVISRYFRDKEGQGLTKNSTETILDMHVGDFVPFAFKGLSQDSVSGFITGRDVKVTAEFTLPIDDTMVKEGIVVKNSKGEEIPYGKWTYEYEKDDAGIVNNKKIVLDFSNLDTDDYIVTTDAEFAIGTEALENAFTLEIKQGAKPIVLFEENFDTGYTFDENWMNSANAENALNAGYTTKNADDSNYRTADGKWDIQADGTPSADEFVGVVDATGIGNGFSGGALKLYNDRSTKYNTGITMVRRNFDKAISLTSGEYEGKRLIFEADLVVLPRLVNLKSSSVAIHGMKVSAKEKAIYEYANSGWKNIFTASSQYRMQEGSYAEMPQGINYLWQTSLMTPNTNKFDVGANLKLIVDQNAEKQTMRMYYNGQLVSKKYLDYLTGHARNGQILADAGDSQYLGQTTNIGNTLYGIWNSAGDATVYIDNFKAYLVDNFEVETVKGNSNVFNTAKATVDYTFTTPVNAETIEGNVTLVDESGKAVSGGITSATLSDAGYKLTVKLSENLPGNTKYSIVLGDGIEDINGLNISKKYYYYNTYNIDDYYTKNANGNYDITIVDGQKTQVVECIYTPRTATTPATLKRASDGNYETPIDCYLPDAKAMKTEVELTTSKAHSLFAEATEATISGDTVTTNVTFTNPETEAMEVLCFIAVYGKYNQMIGCQTINQTIDAGSRLENVPVTIKTKNSEISRVKMYVWNNEEEMDPYHNAEMLYTK